MTSDTSERGLERLICTALTGSPCDPPQAGGVLDSQPGYNGANGTGWICGDPHDYNREYCLDLAQLKAFLHETQPEIAEALMPGKDHPTQRKFLTRLRNEIDKRSTIEVLRHGVGHDAHHLELLYGTPSEGNENSTTLFNKNRFSVVRQLRYSQEGTRQSLDLVLFINGLPIITFELKNSLTKQTVGDAVWQYKRDRKPNEKLFSFGRCVAHFAVDDHEIRFCTHLKGKQTRFLPFNQGWNDGTGNPPNPNGIKTDYLWRKVLTRESLTNVLENYAQVVKLNGKENRRNRKMQIWPRYHQLDVVRKLLQDIKEEGVGKRYLIQHSAGSGKSNSIAWLSHQLISLPRDGKPIFDSIIVVTDRRALDQQICDTIRQYAQVQATVGHADSSGDLRKFIESGKKIIISTIQKFPFILKEIGNEQRSHHFAIIIDEAHSSQGGKTSTAMTRALSQAGQEGEEESYEDQVNRLMESHKLLNNASYFAFTATPKNKTLETFGTKVPQPDGAAKHLPFHSYTMKQAIQEGFILDVLAHYTPIKSYYKLVKTVEDDPKFETKKAMKKLRRYVEGHEHAIRIKAEIMVDHFHERVLSPKKVNGQARAMVVTGGIKRAIQYFHKINGYLAERKSPYKAIVAFSGQCEYDGVSVTETSLNNFPQGKIVEKIREDPYRFLVCAEKFQTGYDEPLLHTMYVDKILSGIKAVQTLSRLNRAHPNKKDVFVLDFQNDVDTIRDSFADFYRTTILADETDPNRLHDLQAELDGYQIYSPEQIDDLVRRFLAGEKRDQLDSILDACVAVYRKDLDEDGQVAFKGKSKDFIRSYEFLSSILPYNNAEWEKRSIFLNLLVPKLPAPIEEDLAQGILDAIDIDSYRVEKQSVQRIMLSDENAEIEPVPMGGNSRPPEPEIDLLSEIIKEFNDLFGDTDWKNSDRVEWIITKDIPDRMATQSALQNAIKNSDEQNVRIEHDKALEHVMTDIMSYDAQLFKKYADDEDFKRWMKDAAFRLTYDKART